MTRKVQSRSSKSFFSSEFPYLIKNQPALWVTPTKKGVHSLAEIQRGEENTGHFLAKEKKIKTFESQTQSKYVNQTMKHPPK